MIFLKPRSKNGVVTFYQGNALTNYEIIHFYRALIRQFLLHALFYALDMMLGRCPNILYTR